MSKVQFHIGAEENVLISLSITPYDNENVFIGKAKIRIPPLSCSKQIQVSKKELASFFGQIQGAYETLRGGFYLESEDGHFRLRGEMTSKGHAQMTVNLFEYRIRQPEDTSYQVEARYTCYPEALEGVLGARPSV